MYIKLSKREVLDNTEIAEKIPAIQEIIISLLGIINNGMAAELFIGDQCLQLIHILIEHAKGNMTIRSGNFTSKYTRSYYKGKYLKLMIPILI